MWPPEAGVFVVIHNNDIRSSIVDQRLRWVGIRRNQWTSVSTIQSEAADVSELLSNPQFGPEGVCDRIDVLEKLIHKVALDVIPVVFIYRMIHIFC